MERNFKHLLLRKTDVFKTLIFSERNLKKCTNFEDQKSTRYIRGEHLYWHYRLQLSFVYKIMSQIFFKLFSSGDKMILSEFLRK